MLKFAIVFYGAMALAQSVCAPVAWAQAISQTKGDFQDKFRQLTEALPTPNIYRTGSGAPGHAYWQQRADYKIKATLDEDGRRLTGSETVTYTNHSPDSLGYLWLQLDQNRFAKHSDAYRTAAVDAKDKMSYRAFRSAVAGLAHDGGFKISRVTGADGAGLAHRVVDAVMRIDLPVPLAPGASITFSVDWSYAIPEGKALGARGGWEHYEKDGNDVFFIAQWYPRMSAYTDYSGWNTKQFLGRGEFTLEFGDFDVEITVPADHVVASTGVLQNPGEVLTAKQRKRLAEARTADKPVFIVTAKEALKAQKKRAKGTRTWHFSAQNVRDFAFAASRKFVWDAWGYHEPSDGRTIMAMSFYPEEGLPLWDKYSTQAIVHTLGTYSKYTFAFPYPVAQSVMGPLGGGMEYPMITSNGPRPEIGEDGKRSYDRRSKYGLISVVIHEIGHGWFPMVVDTDERNWTWMDEGMNSFLQILSEKEWEADYPSRRGDPADIVDYMISENQVPIMTQSDSILQFGNNAYAKPATAFGILRETVMGRENFDHAFKEYARRWKFKRPEPADFFRTMEDASGIDLDWFWRGWFYTTDHVDVSIERVTLAKIDTMDPDVEEPARRQEEADEPSTITKQRNQGIPRRVEKYPELLDFYNQNDKFTVTEKQREEYVGMLGDLDNWEKELLTHGGNIYFIDFSNLGGLVTPLILAVDYADGSSEELRLPAEIWRRNAHAVTKMLLTGNKEITSITLDPHWETADSDVHNNNWPRKAVPSKLELFKDKRRNLMKEVLDGDNKARDDQHRLKR